MVIVIIEIGISSSIDVMVEDALIQLVCGGGGGGSCGGNSLSFQKS
jgi:hypothetical protein